MTVVEFLQDKYKSSGYKTVTDFCRINSVGLSLQAATSVLLRGQEKGLIVMYSLAVGLACTNEEIKWMADEMRDNAFWKLIVKTNLSKGERAIISDYRLLTPEHKALAQTMIKGLVP